MTSSAITFSTFSARIGSIFNNSDSSAVYSAGAFTFKNSSAVTTFSVSDAGAVTAGPAGNRGFIGGADSIVTGIYKNCYVASGSRGNRSSTTEGGAAIECQANPTTGSIVFWLNADNDSTTTAASIVGSVEGTGAWMFGPSGFTGTHTVNGDLSAKRYSSTGYSVDNSTTTSYTPDLNNGLNHAITSSVAGSGTLTINVPTNIPSGAIDFTLMIYSTNAITVAMNASLLMSTKSFSLAAGKRLMLKLHRNSQFSTSFCGFAFTDLA